MDAEQREAYDEILARRSRVPERPAHAEVYEAPKSPTGDLVGPYNAWLRNPGLARRLVALGGDLRFRTSLSPRTTELVILITARRWTARFEWYAHERFARRAGIEPEIIEAIKLRKRPSFERPGDETVYDFCTELLETHEVSDARYDAALEHLGEPGVVELVTLLGFYGAVSMTLNTFRVPVPADAETLPR
jgi:4-carboxymuconolactone decarboxylase